MEYKKFLTFNIIGALLWAAGITYAGYFFGSVFEKLGIDIDQILLPIIFLIILISVLPPAFHVLRNPKNRTVLWESTKREVSGIFSKRSK